MKLFLYETFNVAQSIPAFVDTRGAEVKHGTQKKCTTCWTCVAFPEKRLHLLKGERDDMDSRLEEPASVALFPMKIGDKVVN